MNYRQQCAFAGTQLKPLAITAAMSVRDDRPTVVHDVEMFLSAVDEASKLAGRGMVVSAFTDLMKGNPNPEMIAFWIQEQVDVLNARADGLQAFAAQASKTIDCEAAQPSERLRALEAVARERGEISGMIAEIALMHQVMRVIPKQ